MKSQTHEIVEDGVVVPPSPLLKRLRGNPYGSVPGLDDSELADPDELERQVFRQQFEAVLRLPVKASKGQRRPNIDECGHVDWGAFATVDFDRCRPFFDKGLYKADRVAEHLKDLLIQLRIVDERIKTRGKYLVLKYLRMGILELDHVVDADMRDLGQLYLRALKARRELAELRKSGHQRRRERAEAVLGCP